MPKVRVLVASIGTLTENVMILKALNEDLAVVTRIEPKLPPRTAAEEFLTETDGMEFQFRQRVRDWARRGHEIDVEKMQAERLRRALVIPSPQRRSDPGNWVHKAVPLLPPGDLETPVASLSRT
jgi:hypothetical protein